MLLDCVKKMAGTKAIATYTTSTCLAAFVFAFAFGGMVEGKLPIASAAGNHCL